MRSLLLSHMVKEFQKFIGTYRSNSKSITALSWYTVVKDVSILHHYNFNHFSIAKWGTVFDQGLDCLSTFLLHDGVCYYGAMQGLRTLELCVDNLQPEFLYNHIQPVRAELMQVMLLNVYNFYSLILLLICTHPGRCFLRFGLELEGSRFKNA